MFTSINTIGNAETEIKIECLQPGILKIMPFNHTKIIYRFRANMKFDAAKTEKNKNKCER